MLILIPLHAQAVSSLVVPDNLNQLIEQAKNLDGRTVEVEGEAVGDLMRRGAVTWINISDGTATLGVWGPPTFSPVRFLGRYKTKGDTVRLEGIFRRADPEQGGELAIKATSLRVVKPGGLIRRAIPYGRIVLALGSLLAAAGLCLLWRKATH